MSQRDDYINELESQRKEWNAEIDKLVSKMNNSTTEEKLALQKQIKELQKKYDTVQADMDKLFKETAERLWEELKEGTLQAINLFKKKIEK